MNSNDRLACGRILNHFGFNDQLGKAIEELGELSDVLDGIKTNGMSHKRVTDLIDEIADVEVMLEQVKTAAVIADLVKERVHEKVLRTERRISSGYYELSGLA